MITTLTNLSTYVCSNNIYEINSDLYPTITVEIPTEESMIKDIRLRTAEKGFFNDILSWLNTNAPRKVRALLEDLSNPWFLFSSIPKEQITYDHLCEAVYKLGFRTNKRLERRMMLGPCNHWVKNYFEDFPSKSRR